jgi:hypothetical protein
MCDEQLSRWKAQKTAELGCDVPNENINARNLLVRRIHSCVELLTVISAKRCFL